MNEELLFHLAYKLLGILAWKLWLDPVHVYALGHQEIVSSKPFLSQVLVDLRSLLLHPFLVFVVIHLLSCCILSVVYITTPNLNLVTAVCVLFLIKLIIRWPKKKNIYDNGKTSFHQFSTENKTKKIRR